MNDAGILAEQGAHSVEVVRGYSSVDAVAGNFGVARQQTSGKGAARGPIPLIVAPFLCEGAGAVAVNGFLQEQTDAVFGGARPIFNLLFHCRPRRKTILTRQRMLHLPKLRNARLIGNGPAKACKGLEVPGGDGFAPALCLAAQDVQTGRRRKRTQHGTFLPKVA
jgi:hypothetical protein